MARDGNSQTGLLELKVVMLRIHVKHMQKANAGVLSSLHFPESTNRSGALDVLICTFRGCKKREEKSVDVKCVLLEAIQACCKM